MKNYTSNSAADNNNDLYDVTKDEWSSPEFFGVDSKQILKNFSNNFNKLISESGVSVKDLAEYLSVAPSTIYHWKEGWGIPNYRNICKVAAFFNLPIGKLLSDEENGTILFHSDPVNHQISFAEYLSRQTMIPNSPSVKRTDIDYR